MAEKLFSGVFFVRGKNTVKNIARVRTGDIF